MGYYAGIEAGGTKMVCAVSDEQLNVIKKISIPTTTPEETIHKIATFFNDYSLISMGIGSFGPIGINSDQPDYGYILDTPKMGWEHFNFLGKIKELFPIPIFWTTDVNAAAYGELKLGAAKGLKSCIYLTVGTGIGGGVVINEEVYSGVSHPEMGHLYVKRHEDDTYAGACPYHQDCLEGLAAGPSLEARTGIKGEKLESTHKIWELEAFYIAQALVNYTLTFSPERIVLGGGVMNQDHLIEKIRASFNQLMGGYIKTNNPENYIVKWGLPNESGIMGSLLLAKEVVHN